MKVLETVGTDTKRKTNNKFEEKDLRPAVFLKPDGTIIQLNHSFQKVFGIKQLNNIKDIFDERSLANWENFSRSLTKSKDISFILNYVLPSNGSSSVKVRIYYYEDTKDMIAFFKVPEKRLENHSEYYSSTVGKTKNFMLLTDKNGFIRDVNDRSYEFFNLPRCYFIGKEASIFGGLFPQTSDGYKGFLETIYEDGYAESIDRYEQSAGDIRYYRTITFYDHKAEMFLTHMLDETEIVNLKEGLVQKKSMAEVGQLTASVVNEIMNPLTMLKGFTQLLTATATVETRKYVCVIEEEVERIESILNKLLELTTDNKG